MQLRRKLVVGNWKMNGSVAMLEELKHVASVLDDCPNVDVAICPPFTLIAPARLRASRISIGAQDCHARESGAHTGCISVPMLVEVGATLVIVGHSERRLDQQETDADVRGKAEAALAAGLMTIVCIGESEAARAAGHHVGICSAMLAGSLPEKLGQGELVIAYEPIWAIGTGKVATCEDIAEIHATIRGALVERYGEAGERIRILYGGSVKPDNAPEIFALDDVDGALVGGASLSAAQFVPIIKAAAAPVAAAAG